MSLRCRTGAALSSGVFIGIADKGRTGAARVQHQPFMFHRSEAPVLYGCFTPFFSTLRRHD